MRIEHVALYVNDLENTKKFFMKYLGAKSNAGYHNQKTGFYSYFLTFEDGARIEIMNLPEMADLPKKIVRTGYSHIAFSVGSIEIVDALTAELKADADLVERAVDIKAWYDGYHFGDFDVYCPWDVMNYLLELQRDPKATPISYWKNTSDNAIIRSFIQSSTV